MRIDYNYIIKIVGDTVVRAGTVYRDDKKKAYENAIVNESDSRAKWILESLLENGYAAERNAVPLCDDTGIPHLLLELGDDSVVTGRLIETINEGVVAGLKALPGRPMAVLGNDKQRIEQSGGISPLSESVVPAPLLIRHSKDNITRLHILLFGGGPAIRGRSYRVFHRHSTDVVLDEITKWSIEAVSQLGCSPCTLAIGIGRSHYEASALMLQAQIDGNYQVQSDFETEITRRVNDSGIGPMGLKGDTSVLATFLKVGPQRASGVRIVCLRPCCCFEPRIASVELPV